MRSGAIAAAAAAAVLTGCASLTPPKKVPAVQINEDP